jgi:hypothetical protein
MVSYVAKRNRPHDLSSVARDPKAACADLMEGRNVQKVWLVIYRYVKGELVLLNGQDKVDDLVLKGIRIANDIDHGAVFYDAQRLT